MGFLSSVSDFFALDIGTTSIRVVQLKGSGQNLSLLRYGAIPIDNKISQSDSAAQQVQLLDAIKKLLAATGVSSKNVVLGIPSNRMFTTVVDMPRLSEKELDQTIRYQADQYIPTPLDESKIDWSILGQSPADESKIEVLLTSTTQKYAEDRLDLLESIGLNVIAIEPDAFALSRSLIPTGTNDAIMILDMGSAATDLVVVYGGSPRLVRSIPMGGDSLLKVAQQNLGIDEKQAMQFVYKFGLVQDKLEGQVFKAISSTVDTLITEVDKSINFFSARYNKTPVTKIIVTGRASVLPDFPAYLVNKTNMSVEIGNAWLNVNYPKDSYNDLMAVSNQYAVAVGLAERIV